MSENENWKLVEEKGRLKTKGEYYISDKGNFYSTFSKKLIKKQLDHKGYEYIEIGRKKYKVHRLVGKYFLPNPNNLPDVNHIDGNKENPIASNLEWCTPSENTIHAINNGLRPKVSGRNIERIYQTDLYGNLIAIHENFSDAARKNGRDSVGAIYSACNDNRSYGNCFWVRESDYIDFGISKCKKKRNVKNIDLTKRARCANENYITKRCD